MAERSMWWTTNGTGHGVGSGYASDRWQAMLRKLFTSDQIANACVLNGIDNELVVTGASSPVSVATGAAIDHSFFYENDTAKSLTITTPVVGTTGGHIVLEANWAAQTVTALAIRNTDGVSGIPGLTQVANTTWQVRLATFTITTGGVVTLTDVRKRAKYSNHVYANGFDVSAVDNTTIELAAGALSVKNNGVSDAKLRDSGALSVIGRASNTSGDPADIVAGTDGVVLRRSGTVLGFGLITGANITDNAIDYTKTGAGLIQYTHRQGGDPTDWDIQGTTDYAVATSRMCSGRSIGLAGAGNKNITFPFTFGKKPNIQATSGSAGGFVLVYNKAVTGFSFAVFNAAGTQVAAEIDWVAVGEE